MRPPRRTGAIVLALVASCLAITTSPARAESTSLVTTTVSGPTGLLATTTTGIYRYDRGQFNPLSPPHIDDGQLQIPLPDGRYLLKFADAAGRHTTEFYGGSRTESGATEIVVDGADVALAPVVLSPRTRVHGRVVDPAGQPVFAHDVECFDDTSYYHDPVDVVETDENGTFEAWLDPGAYRFRFLDAGWGVREVYEFWPGDRYYYEDAAVVPVAGSEIDLGELTVSAGGEISAAVRDESGVPISGARVNVISSTDGIWRSVLTDQSGRFSVGRLFEGDYRVWVGDAGHVPRFVGPDSTFENAQAVSVDADVPTVLPDIVLAARDPAGQSVPGELSGVLRGPSGAPLPGVRLRARNVTGEILHQDRRAVTDADGRYRFTGLQGTEWLAWEIHYVEDVSSTTSRPVIKDSFLGGSWPDEAQRVWIPPFGPTVLDLAPAMYGGIDVRVTSEDPQAYRAADVALWTEDGMSKTVLRKDGDVFRSTTVEPGRYVLRAAGWRATPFGVSYDGPWWYPNTRLRAAAVPLTIEEGVLLSDVELVIGDREVPPAAEDPPARNMTKPRVLGRPLVGETLVADPGTWDQPGTQRFRWVGGGRTIGTGASLVVPRTMAGNEVVLEVTHLTEGRSVTASSATVTVARMRPTVMARTVGSDVATGRRRIRVVVTVEVSPDAGPGGGTVRLLRRGRELSVRQPVSGSHAVLRIARLRPGRHVLRVDYLGAAASAPASTRLVIRIPPTGRADR